ncbi:hypothetical protein JKF63_06998 [Porcisia hertigi]|uniref:DNA ligase n=1 Tax=Porcisia hertigi TaxID=2761500 RepID=A0A836IZQ3_9TRYP|nr:hypothetical protein JKF63_06998 [Porcisia hertigi]
MLQSCRRLLKTLPFVPMALSTLDMLEHRLQAAGLGGTTSTASAPQLPAAPSGRSVEDKTHQFKWFSNSVSAPFFVSPKHDGVRLISYVPPTIATQRPSSKQAPSKAKKKTSSTTGESSPLMTCYTRSGRPIYGLFWIEEELRLLRALCGDASLIIDGELYLHRTDMDTSPLGQEGQAETLVGRKKRTAGTPLLPPHANGTRPLPATADTFQTGFLAVAALVKRLRGPTSRCASENDILQYVPSLPRLCIFDVPSYSPCANPLAPPTCTSQTPISVGPASLLHAGARVPLRDDRSSHRVVAEIQRVRKDVGAALGLYDLEQLRVVPNLTPFSQRLRAMHYLFELLSRGMESPVLRQHFCPTTAHMCSAPKTRDVGNRRTRPARATQVHRPESDMIRYHGGHFVSRIPYHLVASLEDTTQRILPVYLGAGYEGAVIRAPVNTYEFKEKTKGTLTSLVAPLLWRPTKTGRSDGGRQLSSEIYMNGDKGSSRRARNRAALLLSLNSGAALSAATPLMVRAYRGDAPRREPVQPVSPSDAGLTDAEMNALDVVAVGRRAVLQGAKLPQRSLSAVKILTYHDREYAILRPLLKEPSTNPKTRELASIPRSQVRALGYAIKPNTDMALSGGVDDDDDYGAPSAACATQRPRGKKTMHTTTDGAHSLVHFYGLECLAENGLVFNVSLPKMTLAQQKTLLQHLLSAGSNVVREGGGTASASIRTRNRHKRASVKASCGTAARCAAPSKMVSLTGLYATVKFSTLTEHGLPRFGSVKAIRGGKGWFM